MTDVTENKPAEDAQAGAADLALAEAARLKREEHLKKVFGETQDEAKMAMLLHEKLKMFHEAGETIMRFFAFGHLPLHLKPISMSFCALAVGLVENLPRNAERTVALRKLLEAKDAAVRAAL